MRGLIRSPCLSLLMLLLCAGCIAADEPVGQADFAPLFSLKDMDDNPVALADYRGKSPVLLFFWTSWCSSCRRELRNLNNNSSALKESGIEILSINIGESDAAVRRFIGGLSLDFKVLLDKHTITAGTYKIFGIPTFFLIDKEGRILSKGHNFSPRKYKALLE